MIKRGLKKGKEQLKDYAQATSIHGIPDIRNASKWMGIFWIIALIIACGLTAWEINNVFADFNASPIITTREVVSEKSMKLPQIEICLTNKINKQRVQQERIAPVLINYIKLMTTSEPDFDLVGILDQWAKTTGHHRANPGLYLVALQPNRKKALECMTKLGEHALVEERGGTKGLTYMEVIALFAIMEAEVSEAVGHDGDKVRKKSYDFLELVDKLQHIQKVMGDNSKDLRNQNRFTMLARMGLTFSSVMSNQYLHRLLISQEDPQVVVADVFNDYVIKSEADVFELHYKNIEKYIDPETGDLAVDVIQHSVSYDASQVFINCRFANRELDCMKIVKKVFDARFGSCFLITIDQEQVISGQGILLNMNTMSSLGWVETPSIEEGIHVRLHKDYNPVGFDSFRVPTRSSGVVILKATHYQLSKSEKYGGCKRATDENSLVTLPYNSPTCRMECMGLELNKTCGCLFFTLSRSLIKKGITYKSCAEMGNMKCLLSSDFFNRQCISKCKPVCEYWTYTPTVTYATHPSQQYKEWAKDMLNATDQYQSISIFIRHV